MRALTKDRLKSTARAVSVIVLLLLLASCGNAPAVAPTATNGSPVPTSAIVVSPTVQATATPAEPVAGRYLIVIDTAFVREGPGIAFPIASGGIAQAGYNTVIEFDAVVKGDQVSDSRWWGHLASGLGFVSMAATQLLAASAAVPAAAQPPFGQYGVAVDGAYVREGPGRTYAAANGGGAVEAYGATLDIDAVVQGEPINGNPWWGHLTNGLGFVSMGALGKPSSPVSAAPVRTPTTGPASGTGGSSAQQPTAAPPATMPPTVQQPTAEQESRTGNTSGVLGGAPPAGAAQVQGVGFPSTEVCASTSRREGDANICIDAAGVSPNTLYHIYLKRFPPRQQIQLDLFRQTRCTGPISRGRCFAYVASVVTAATDSRGETIYELQSDANDLPGTYLVRPAGSDKIQAELTIEQTGRSTPVPPTPEPPTAAPPATDPPTAAPPTVEPTSHAAGDGLLGGAPPQGAAQVVERGQPLERPCDAGLDMICVDPAEGPKGTTFHIYLSKYPAAQALQLDFYRASTCPPAGPFGTVRTCYTYVASATTAVTNSRGETVFDIQTGEGDIASKYRVQVAGFPSYWEHFGIQ